MCQRSQSHGAAGSKSPLGLRTRLPPALALIRCHSLQPILTDTQGWRFHSFSAVLCQGCTTFTEKLCSLIHPEALELPSVAAAPHCIAWHCSEEFGSITFVAALQVAAGCEQIPLHLLPVRLSLTRSPSSPCGALALPVGQELWFSDVPLEQGAPKLGTVSKCSLSGTE